MKETETYCSTVPHKHSIKK